MNTKDRNGASLPTDIAPTVDFLWSVRIAATGGTLNDSTNWTYYEIPSSAVLQRERSSTLDGGTWEMKLSILAEALPPLTEPLAYYQLEVDLIDDAGNAWPYHSGPIDTVAEAWSMEGGALVRAYEVQSFGVMQRTKGLDFNSLSVTPRRTSFANYLTGFAQMRVIAMSGGTAGGAAVEIPGAVQTVDMTTGTGTYPAVVVSGNADFSSPFTYGVSAGYTITNAAGTAAPTAGENAYIKWGATAVIPATYYVKFWSVAYFGIAQNVSARPEFIRVPGGSVTYSYGTTRIKRQISDDFATLSTGASTTTAITVYDPEPFKSGNALVAVSGGPTEFLEWTSASTGAKEVRQISSVSAGGVITVSAFSAAPADGDLIRLVTTQQVRAWERHNRDSAQGASNPLFYTDAGVTEIPKGTFEIIPQDGIIRPRVRRHWFTGSIRVYAQTIWQLLDATVAYGSDNRLESLYYNMLASTSLPLVATTALEFGTPFNTFFKNISRSISSLDQLLDEVGRDGLPPNGYVHDRPSGAVALGTYRQKTSPDCVLSNVIGVQIGALPEPVTQVTVRVTGEERIITSDLEPTVTGTWTAGTGTNATIFLFDGNNDPGTSNNNYSRATSGATVSARVRLLDGSIYPKITKIEVSGLRGLVECYGEYWDSNTTAQRIRQVEGFGFKPIQQGAPVVITAEELDHVFTSLAGFDTGEIRIVLKFYDNALGSATVNSDITEIAYYGNIETGWSAFLSDDTTAGTGAAPSGWTTLNAQGFGSFYWVRDAGQARSFRYADPAYLKRVQPLYAATWGGSFFRREIIDLTRINQTEARKIAESYLDEYVRQGREYTVTALLDPRIDLGDTVNVTLGDGSSMDLFVWGISDSGGPESFETTYTLLDYGA